MFDFGQEEDFDSIVPSQGGPHFGFRSPIVFSSMESSFSGILLLLCVFFLFLLLETFIFMHILICLRYYPLLCVCCFLVEKFYSFIFFHVGILFRFLGFLVVCLLCGFDKCLLFIGVDRLSPILTESQLVDVVNDVRSFSETGSDFDDVSSVALVNLFLYFELNYCHIEKIIIFAKKQLNICISSSQMLLEYNFTHFR